MNEYIHPDYKIETFAWKDFVGYLLICSAIFIPIKYIVTFIAVFFSKLFYEPDYEKDISYINFKYGVEIAITIPIIETFILIALIHLLLKLFKTQLAAILISTSIFSLIHGAVAFESLLSSFIAFYVYSHNYLLWRHFGFKYGFVAAVAPHALNNSLVIVLVNFL